MTTRASIRASFLGAPGSTRGTPAACSAIPRARKIVAQRVEEHGLREEAARSHPRAVSSEELDRRIVVGEGGFAVDHRRVVDVEWFSERCARRDGEAGGDRGFGLND